MSIQNLVISFLKSNTRYPFKAWQLQSLANARDIYVNPETIQRVFRKIKSNKELLDKEGIVIKELPKKGTQCVWKVERIDEKQLELI